jgi:hypothetical protein
MGDGTAHSQDRGQGDRGSELHFETLLVRLEMYKRLDVSEIGKIKN